VAGRLLAKRIDRFDGRIESIQQRTQLAQQALSGIGRSDAARRSVQ
jgi:hypothetical protein